MSYAKVNSMSSDGSGITGSQIYLWGTVPAGLNMKLHSQVIVCPEEMEAMSAYNFSKIKIGSDFAIGSSHAVRLTF